MVYIVLNNKRLWQQYLIRKSLVQEQAQSCAGTVKPILLEIKKLTDKKLYGPDTM